MEESFLFSDSVRANIAYGRPDATEEQILAAARAAEADEFIRELPDGYDSVVGEQGLTLSGGQRQRVALARALITDPRLLLLDDATSAVDPRIEAEIHATLHRVMAGRTTLLIAHRKSTLNLADRIAVHDRRRPAGRRRHRRRADRALRAVPGADHRSRRRRRGDRRRRAARPGHSRAPRRRHRAAAGLARRRRQRPWERQAKSRVRSISGVSERAAARALAASAAGAGGRVVGAPGGAPRARRRRPRRQPGRHDRVGAAQPRAAGQGRGAAADQGRAERGAGRRRGPPTATSRCASCSSRSRWR